MPALGNIVGEKEDFHREQYVYMPARMESIEGRFDFRVPPSSFRCDWQQTAANPCFKPAALYDSA